jgi:hypothetical protein
MAKRKSKKQSFYAPGPTIWRVLFGHNGPTKKNLKKAWREWTGATARANTQAARIVPGGRLKQNRNGTFQFVVAKPKRRPTTKQYVANVQNRIATEADRHAAAQRTSPKPMTQRVKRKPDGTFNGSKRATLTPAEREAAQHARTASAAYRRGEKSAAASERRIKRELGH